MKLFFPAISLVFSLCLMACSQMSKIEKVNESESHFKDAIYEGQIFNVADEIPKGDQYRIFHQASSGFTGTSGIRQSAEARAKQYCKELNNNSTMVKVSEFTAKPPYILGNFPRIEIVFVCSDQKKSSNVVESKDKYEKLSQLKKTTRQRHLDPRRVFERKKQSIIRRVAV